MTVEGLSQTMTEREFSCWMAFARQNGGLPKKRLEMLVADNTRMVHQAMGGGNQEAPLSDYLLKPDPDAMAAVEPLDDVEAAKAAFGFAPIKKKAVD